MPPEEVLKAICHHHLTVDFIVPYCRNKSSCSSVLEWSGTQWRFHILPPKEKKIGLFIEPVRNDCDKPISLAALYLVSNKQTKLMYKYRHSKPLTIGKMYGGYVCPVESGLHEASSKRRGNVQVRVEFAAITRKTE